MPVANAVAPVESVYHVYPVPEPPVAVKVAVCPQAIEVLGAVG